MDFLTLIQVLDSTIRLATPLLLACLAGLFSERAGIFDIGLEGKMLAAAFFSAAIAAITGDVWMGLGAGIAASMALSLVHGLASITFRGNQLISGVAINFLAAGLTVLIAQSWFQQGGRTPSLIAGGRFEPITLPFAEALSIVPVFGPIYAELISGHSILVYVALLAVPTSWDILFRTRFGLRLRAVGENPGAVDTAGISVVRLRFTAVTICGLLCGIAGAYLATGLAAGFVKDMTAGRGFIALAALIFAKWRPWYALYACFLFGFLEAIGNRYQSIELAGFIVPVQFMQALPYILPFFESESPVLREASVVTLRYLNQVVRCEPALALAKDESNEVRRSAILTLGYLSDDPVVPMLCDAIANDPDWQVRRNAAQSLDLHATPEATQALTAAMADEHWQVRKFTARALQKVATDETIPCLIKALSDEYSDVRRDSAIALGNLGNPEVLPALQQTLDDPDRDVQIFSQRAIKKIQDQLAETSNA